jgi:hypothetical protein
LDDAFLLLPTSFSKVMQKQQATMVNFAVVALWAPGGGGDLEIFIRDGVTKDMVCLILMS